MRQKSKPKKERRPRGRPRKELDAQLIEKLCSEGGTVREIADLFDVSPVTLRRNYSLAIRKGRAELYQSLRRKQVSVALGGNTALLIWLGKNLLGQRDKLEQEITEITGGESAERLRERAKKLTDEELEKIIREAGGEPLL